MVLLELWANQGTKRTSHKAELIIGVSYVLPGIWEEDRFLLSHS